MLTRKKYVGTAKIFPDSLTPRRFPNAISTTKKIEIGSWYGRRASNAETRAAVPAATDTATVRT